MKTRPKETPRVEPEPQNAFIRAKRTVRRHLGKFIAGTLLAGLLYGIGEWASTTGGEWLRHHHLLTDDDQADLRKDHWALIRLQNTVSNLIDNQPVGNLLTSPQVLVKSDP